MNIKEYVKQRWYMILIIFALGLFTLLVAWASLDVDDKDFYYIVQGGLLAFWVFAIIDYTKLNSRINKMQEYLDNGCVTELKSNYPLDIKYATMIQKKIDEHNQYKQETENEHSSELEFITKWVHDVKVPVSAIKLLAENMDSEESQHIEMQLNYIEQNIEKILYNMKSKTFYDDYRISKVNLKSIVNQALKSFGVFFAYKSISLKIDVKDYNVYTDEKWSIYIVSQLISNAVKYTGKGEDIKISTDDRRDEILLIIKNTGVGIDNSNIKNIFKRGYSSYSTRKEKSTGYGLYLSKKLSDKMGHRLDVKSEPKKYVEFKICFKKHSSGTYVAKM